jgi:uncharacterized protein
MNSLLPQWSSVRKPVIGMLHLLPLLGSAQFGGDLAAISTAMLRDAEALVKGGVHGLMLENFGDVPFYPGRVPAHVISHMTVLAGEVRRRFTLPIGVNVLRNDGQSALAIANAIGAEIIRVNVLCGARVTDQGLIQGIAHDLLRERAAMGATKRVRILADVDVKHSAPLAQRPLKDEVEDTIERGLADGIVVSGAGTGKTTEVNKVRGAKAAAPQTPVFIGSGITSESVRDYLECADGFIVGSAFKKDGIATNAVEISRVTDLLRRLG